jgi:hypothetical protein
VADDNDTRDWAVGGRLQQGRTRAGSEKQQRQRSGDDDCSGGRWRQRTTTAKADNDSGGQQWHARLGGRLRRGRTRAGGKRQWRHGVAMMAAEAANGGGG